MAHRASFASCPEESYFLQPYAVRPADAPRHQLGGLPAEPAPCPDCGLHLILLLSLDTNDHRLSLTPNSRRRVDLLLCPLCRQTQYAVGRSGKMVGLAAGDPATAPSGPPFPARAPSPVVLHAVPERIVATKALAAEGRLEEAANWVNRFDWNTPADQVGGVPTLLNESFTAPVCLPCLLPMPFLACIAALSDGPVAGNDRGPGQALFFHCRTCGTIHGRQDWQDI